MRVTVGDARCGPRGECSGPPWIQRGFARRRPVDPHGGVIAGFWLRVYERMLGALDLPSTDGLREQLYAGFTDLANYVLFDDVPEALDDLAAAGRDPRHRVELRGVAR